MLFARDRQGTMGWLLMSLLAILLVLLLVLLARQLYHLFGADQQAEQTAVHRQIPNTDVNPYGANFFLAREVEAWKIDKTLLMASEAGIGWVKQQFAWAEIEPRRKGEFLTADGQAESWAKFDRIVEACEKYDLEIVARLDRPPNWTREDNSYLQAPPDDLNDYGDFVYAFVKHYKGRINYIQIWNEPNIFPEWGNQPADPEAYAEMLAIAYRRAKEADPNIYVLSAPLAITLGEPHPEEGKWRSMSDLQYLEAIYQAGAAQSFDIYSANAFGMDYPPADPPSADKLNFQRVLLQRQIMEQYGDADKTVWFNEYGWNAAPADFSEEKLTWQRVSEKQQVEYTLQGIELAREEWPWAGVFMIWYFRQVGNIQPDQADYYFRMVDPDFVPRQLYFAVQDVAEGQDTAGPGLHQETSPSVKTYGDWQNVIDSSAQGKAYVQSGQPGDSLTLQFEGQGVDLLTFGGNRGGRLLVSLDGHPVSDLPHDEQGLSYVDLHSETSSSGVRIPRIRIPLVSQAAAGEHTLRITVDDISGEGEELSCAIDAFDVIVGDDTNRPIYVSIALAVGLLVTGYLLWRTWRRFRWVLQRG